MANYERANHDHDEHVFDGGDDDDGNEGSHLPVVIIIAILVLAAFGGVVWLAYNQGVARGRGDVPVRVAATQPSKTDNDSGIKVFQQRAGAEEDSAPPTAAPPAAAPPAAAAPAPQAAQTQAAQTPAAPAAAQIQAPPPVLSAPVQAPPPAKIVAPKTVAQAPAVQPAAPPVTKPAPQTMAAAKPVPQEPLTATKPPAALGMVHATPKPETVKPVETTKPAAVAKADAPVKPAVSGSYLLQIGAYKSDEEARAAWKVDVVKHGTLLNGFGPDVQRFEKPDGSTWYRLRFGSFADRGTAAALCDRLKAQGRDCLVVK